MVSVLIVDISRLARNTDDLLHVVRHFHKNRVGVITISGRPESLQERSTTGISTISFGQL